MDVPEKEASLYLNMPFQARLARAGAKR